MIVNYLVRMLALSVEKALDMFSHARSPGIYKHYYIRCAGARQDDGFPLICGSLHTISLS